MRLTGSDDWRISDMSRAAVLVGCDRSGSRTAALNRFCFVSLEFEIESGTYRFVVVFAFYWHCECVSR